MATVFVVASESGSRETIFASEELAKKSIEFSCHKLEGEVTYADDWSNGHSTIATCPNGDKVTIEEIHVFDRVTHL